MIPTRSQVEAYSTDHLVDAAEYWDGLADRWEDAHWQVRNQAHALDWQGFAGDALRARTASDYIVASDHADLLGGTSRIARQQAGELERLRNRVLYAVEDAHDADFTVGEDLSVTDTRTSRTTAELAARQAQAQVFAADIRSRAGALIGADTEVAGNLTAAAAGVGTTPFIEKPAYQPERNGTIQLAGFGAKQDPQLPPPPPAPQPDPPPIKLPPRTGPPPVAVITAAPPEVPPGPPTTITGTPLCPGDKILGHLLEILAGGALVGVSGAAEAPSLGTSTAGILGGGSLIYNGIDGLETCP
jgi:hypothetical protein